MIKRLNPLVFLLIIPVLLVPAVSLAAVYDITASGIPTTTAYCNSLCWADNKDVTKPIYSGGNHGYDFVRMIVDADGNSMAVWSQPAASCGSFLNGTCGNTTQTAHGKFTLVNVSVNTSSVISFQAKPCDFIPTRYDTWLGKAYYGTDPAVLAPNVQNLGFVSWTVDSVGSTSLAANYPVYVGFLGGISTWRTYSIDFSGSGYSGLVNITFDVWPGAETSNADCVQFRNIQKTYDTSRATAQSPAVNYIADMVTLTAFPYNNIVGSTNAVSLSRAFATIPLMEITEQGSAWIYSGSHCTQDFGSTTLQLGYIDGKNVTVPVRQISWTGYPSCTEHLQFPIYNYSTLKNVTWRTATPPPGYGIGASTGSFNLTANPALRALYASPLGTSSDFEQIYGQPSLYPVLIYDNYVNSTGGHSFKAYNFGPSQYSISNLNFGLYNSTYGLKDVSYGSYTFPAGQSSWSSGWSYGATQNDRIIVNFTSTISKTDTVVSLGNAASSCEPECIGNDYVNRVPTSGLCNSFTYVNDSRCYTAPVPSPGIGNVDYSSPVIDLGIGSIFVTPLFWFGISIIAIGAVVGFFAGAEIGVGSMLLLALIYTTVGIFPFWLGLVFIVIAGLMLAAMLTKAFTGGGSTGG